MTVFRVFPRYFITFMALAGLLILAACSSGTEMRPGAPAATSYEGEGFVTIRHHDTDVVRAALERIVQVARVEFVESD